MAVQIQLRRDSAANWTSNNPTLASGEIGIETDTLKFKIGDGSTAWTSLDYHARKAELSIIIDGGGSAITTGIKGDLEVPFNCTITSVTLLADQSGAIKIDIWKDSYANFPPTDADTITGANEPEIVASGVKYQDNTLTDWTTSLSEGGILRFNVDSVATIQRVTLSLKVDKV